MKKIFTPIFLFFLVINSFAQNSNVSLEKLLEINNGTAIFTRLIESSLPSIPVDKQTDFKQKAEALSQSQLKKAKNYFEKKYNQKDLDEIYAEMAQEDRVSFSEKTTIFMREWRSFKTEYQSEFKKLSNTYQK